MSALLEPTVLEVRLLNTGDGLGEKLPLMKSHILPAPPFRPRPTHYYINSNIHETVIILKSLGK